MDFGTLRTMTSVLMSRMGLARIAGQTFDGLRDVWRELGYADNVTAEKYWARYRRGGIAARIVEAYPEDTWHGDVEVLETEDPKTTTAFEAAWESLEKRLHVTAILRRADILSGLGEFSIIVIGGPGALETPLPVMRSEAAISYLQCYAQKDVRWEDADVIEDTTSVRWGQPEFYRVKRMNISLRSEKKVHWSRVIHLAQNRLDNDLAGAPVLEKVWNYLDDLDKVAGGGAEAFWANAKPGIQFDLDKDVRLPPAQQGGPKTAKDVEDKMSKELEEFQHGLRRFIRTRGVQAKVLNAQLLDYSGPGLFTMTLISATTGIPARILMGSERGELASTQDRNNWYERVQSRRTKYADPYIIRPFVDRLIEFKAFPKPKEFFVRWPNVHTLTDLERAQLANAIANVNKNMGKVVWTEDELRDRIWQMEPLKPEEKTQPPPPPQPGQPGQQPPGQVVPPVTNAEARTSEGAAA